MTIPSPCSLTMQDAVVHAAFDTDEEAQALYDLLSSRPTSTMERDSLVARPDADELYSIIIDLFAPDRHFDGCLFKANGNMPCQCGYQERMVRYKVAVEKAKAIASKHDYMCWEASYAD